MALLIFFTACGLPTYTTIDPPDVEDTDDIYSLAFTPDSDTDDYIVAYKIYWDNETTLINSDEETIDDDDEVEAGFDTLDDLDFVQMATIDTDSSGDYPDDSTDITIEASSTVTLTFDTDTGELSVTGADNVDVLYRRVQTMDSSGDTTDEDIDLIDFVSAEYDYQDTSSYTVNSETIESDDDGMDSDIYEMFTDEDRFYGESYEYQSIVIAVAVYASGFDYSTLEAEESVPVYLGTVSLNPQYWDPNN
ncbi:MAG: hypothetical protein PQJ60_12000 [Spirochaetales bacterium]|nr:hypothetical protein [Spirochaetales bacterium]